jgi:hypothetical protein
MKRAIVVYRSHSGVPRRYADEIGAYLVARGVASSVASVGECDPASLAVADFVLLGCWTSGLMVILQHPDMPWLAFARDIPPSPGPKTALFTTYKLATGSQFRRMRAALAGRVAEPALELKSRDGRLSAADRAALDRFIA